MVTSEGRPESFPGSCHDCGETVLWTCRLALLARCGNFARALDLVQQLSQETPVGDRLAQFLTPWCPYRSSIIPRPPASDEPDRHVRLAVASFGSWRSGGVRGL